MKYKKIHSWDNQTLYHAMNDKKMIIPFTVTNIVDKIGSLKRVECSLTGDFEVYGMKEVKKRIEHESIKVYFN